VQNRLYPVRQNLGSYCVSSERLTSSVLGSLISVNVASSAWATRAASVVASFIFDSRFSANALQEQYLKNVEGGGGGGGEGVGGGGGGGGGGGRGEGRAPLKLHSTCVRVYLCPSCGSARGKVMAAFERGSPSRIARERLFLNLAPTPAPGQAVQRYGRCRRNTGGQWTRPDTGRS